MIIKEKGTIVRMMDEQSGTSKTGNPWTSREFVVETEDEGYKNNIHFKAFGRECDEVRDCKVGDKVEVSYKPTSREYNGRWYDEHRLFGVVKVEAPAPVKDDQIAKQDDLPF